MRVSFHSDQTGDSNMNLLEEIEMGVKDPTCCRCGKRARFADTALNSGLLGPREWACSLECYDEATGHRIGAHSDSIVAARKS
jgi:hypothetical protein